LGRINSKKKQSELLLAIKNCIIPRVLNGFNIADIVEDCRNHFDNTSPFSQIFGWILWQKSKISTYARKWSVDCAFKSTKKLNHGILGLLSKSKTTGHCGFPLANLQKGPRLGFAPESKPFN
jgi:hypothetical protein